jgi:hypothetical protein
VWTLLITAALSAEPARWEAGVGGQVDPPFHGVARFSWTRGPVAFTYNTDTFDLRWQPRFANGTAWIGGRVQLGAAGMMIAPWTSGRPDDARARLGLYEQVEAGAQRWLPAGLYVGGQIGVRGWQELALATTRGALAAPAVHLSPTLSAGWWRPYAEAQVHGGVDVIVPVDGAPVRAAPRISGVARSHLPGVVVPVVQIAAGWAEGQDDRLKTRIGSSNPYVVPLAGAAWAEWWVEDYAAFRGGAMVQTAPVDVGLIADAAAFDGQRAVGFGAMARARLPKGWGLSLDAGWAPWLARAQGPAVSVFGEVTVRGEGRANAPRRPPTP